MMQLTHMASRAVASVLFPDTCLACRMHVAERGTLCPDCWSQLHFIAEPVCDVYGTGEAYCGFRGLGIRTLSAAFPDEAEPAEARMLWVDQLGFDVRVITSAGDGAGAGKVLDVRVPFPAAAAAKLRRRTRRPRGAGPPTEEDH